MGCFGPEGVRGGQQSNGIPSTCLRTWSLFIYEPWPQALMLACAKSIPEPATCSEIGGELRLWWLRRWRVVYLGWVGVEERIWCFSWLWEWVGKESGGLFVQRDAFVFLRRSRGRKEICAQDCLEAAAVLRWIYMDWKTYAHGNNPCLRVHHLFHTEIRQVTEVLAECRNWHLMRESRPRGQRAEVTVTCDTAHVQLGWEGALHPR